VNFLILGILSFILSFLPERFSFFIVRALGGITAAALACAAFKLIVAHFEPHELGKAFTLYCMAGSLGNVLGLELAGVIALILGTGQMAGVAYGSKQGL
jgi:MFS family permease